MNSAAIDRLPDTEGLKNEVIIQKSSPLRIRAPDHESPAQGWSGWKRVPIWTRRSPRARR